MVCNFYFMVPVGRRAKQLMDDGMDIWPASEQAMSEVPKFNKEDLPRCLNSNNGDGRHNMSYEGSCFYTIDHGGIAICKEFPNEDLDLSDDNTLVAVAATIYSDITGTSFEDPGMEYAVGMFKYQLPEWKGENVMPHEREEQEEEAEE